MGIGHHTCICCLVLFALDMNFNAALVRSGEKTTVREGNNIDNRLLRFKRTDRDRLPMLGGF